MSYLRGNHFSSPLIIRPHLVTCVEASPTVEKARIRVTTATFYALLLTALLRDLPRKCYVPLTLPLVRPLPRSNLRSNPSSHRALCLRSLSFPRLIFGGVLNHSRCICYITLHSPGRSLRSSDILALCYPRVDTDCPSAFVRFLLCARPLTCSLGIVWTRHVRRLATIVASHIATIVANPSPRIRTGCTAMRPYEGKGKGLMPLSLHHARSCVCYAQCACCPLPAHLMR